MDKNQEEIFFRLSLFEQQIKQLQEQLRAVEQALIETSSLKIDLDELRDSEDREVFSSIGKGIFIQSKITSTELLVDAGGKNFVKKTIPETQELIQKQVEKLENIKMELEQSLENINGELSSFFEEAQRED